MSILMWEWIVGIELREQGFGSVRIRDSSGVGSGSEKKSRIRILLSKNDLNFGIFISKNQLCFCFQYFFIDLPVLH